MFIQNKYYKWYFYIISKAKSRSILYTYAEKHHIIPKSLGGSNRKDNLVVVTAREHFILHLLLTKITTGNDKKKMFYALNRLQNSRKGLHINSRIYQYLRTNHSNIIREFSPLKEYNLFKKDKSYDELYSSEISLKRRIAISEANSRRIWSKESREKMSKSKRGVTTAAMLGPKSETHKAALSQARKELFIKKAKSFSWYHSIYGNFIGTRYDLVNAFPDSGIKINEIEKVITGKYRSHMGWSILI